MTKVFTEQGIVDAGIRAVNFFNGRLLTAEDLTAEQTANVQARRLLGQALGDGVAEGLSVSLSGKPEDFTIRVEAGLAVNRRGDVLKLADQTSVSLTGSLKNPGEQTATVFSDCTSTPSGQFTPTGLYLLTISPAASGEGRAPTSGLGNSAAACNTRFIVQGVTFHLIRLSTPAITDQLRNILAYQAFGFLPLTDPLTASAAPLAASLEAPFNPPPAGYGLLDALSADKYPICHVPLALIFTASGRIDFIDNWTVRRRVTAPTASQPWQVFESPRRRSEKEAAFLQFQEHLGGLIEAKEITPTFKAPTRFKLLPPVGILPGPASACDWRTFLGTHAPAYETKVDSGLLTGILEEALACSPFVVEDSKRPPAAVDVFAIQGSASQVVKAIDANLAGQMEQVGRDAIYRLLNSNQPNPSFVLFARSRRGRIRLFFTPHNFQSSKASFNAAATESNLELQATPLPSGDFVFPGAEQGFYLVKGSIQGFKPIAPSVAEVIAGQITRVQVSPQAFTLRPCIVSEFIDKFELKQVRFCLVEGTFEDSIILSESKPWANYVPIDLNSGTAKEQIMEWQLIFNERFPDLGIDKGDPQVYLTENVSGQIKGVVEAGAKILLARGVPAIPPAYVVFGEIGFPLTFVANTNINRDPIPLAEVFINQLEKGTDFSKSAVTIKVLKMLIEYGVNFLEQAAGGWTDLIMDAAGISKTQAALFIQTAARLLVQIDQGK